MGCAVAIVDDDESVRDSLEWLLEADSYDAHSYGSAQAFLSRLGEGEVPDCIILDIHIPDANGLEVRKRLLQRFPEIPVIFITGYPDHGLAQQARSLDAAGFFVKPLDPGNLLESLRVLLRTDSLS